MGKGFAESLEHIGTHTPLGTDLHEFLNHFLIARIARRMMAQQHVMLHQQHTMTGGQVGVISRFCSPLKCLNNVVPVLREMCER